jgi:signal transduction histidine kinase
MRNQAVAQNTNIMAQQQAVPFQHPVGSTDLSGVLMTPLWLGGHLVLARRVEVDGKLYVQGCLLDWQAIKTSLLESVADLLPAAELLPAPEGQPEKQGRMLAALPVWLVPGPLPAAGSRGLSPVQLTLWIAWGAVLLAALAVALLLGGVVRLSQRRAAFVSAVTHELRTPLTTFHVYTEMLSEGMIPDAHQRQQYLETLRTEASRLTHLVENVLAYARLERGRPVGRLEELTLWQLLRPIEGRLADRARQAGMELTLEVAAGAGEAFLRANPSAVEQILFNLVDNACKYAAGAADRRIHLSADEADGCLQLAISDHGPGISPAASRRLFRSFSKSAQEAANTAPGVGLGLALSRRLARDMGARLELDRHAVGGARFVLRLPLARSGADE